MKKFINYFIATLSLLLIGIVYHFTTSISFFLATVILSSIFFFIINMNSEREIGKAEMANPNLSYDKAKNKRHVILTLFFLLLIYSAAVITEKRVMMPGGNSYFKNIDHNGLNHFAISFKDNTSFNYIDQEDSSISKIAFSKQGNNFTIHTENFNEPIFQKIEKEKFKIINATPGATLSNTIISNGQNTLRFSFRNLEDDKYEFNISIESTDVELLAHRGQSVLNSQLTFETKPIKYGISLNNLIKSVEDFKISKPGDYEILNEILSIVGNTYILTNYATPEEKNYILFKTNNIEDYKLISDNHEVSNSRKFQIPSKQNFYIGFANSKAEMYLDTLDNESAIFLNYPNTYYLSSPEESPIGAKCTRFITNHTSRLKDIYAKEGFCFQNSNLVDNSYINGSIEYRVGNAKENLSINYIDKNLKPLKFKQAKNNEFALTNSDNNSKYHFKIIDYANNGFAYNKVLLYTFLLLVMFACFTVLSNPGTLRRFQPILLFTLFGLIVLRFILYWRIATFPPLDNISKHELENTFRLFDFKLISFDIPFPTTILFVFVILTSVALYRFWNAKSNKKNDKDPNRRIVFFSKLNIDAKYHLLIIYLSLLLLCFILSKIPFDFITRVSTILIPTLLYIIFSQRCNQQYTLKHIDKMYQSTWLDKVRAYIFYFIQNPTFNLTASTIIFFALTDRGYCVLFILFILLKNILLNFLKKSIGKSKVSIMLSRPWNYWVYGFAALLIYFLFITQKSLFYYLLYYKLLVGGILLAIIAFTINLFRESKKFMRFGSVAILGIYLVVLVIPSSRQYINQKIENKIKHVQYRASIIHQPISKLLEQNEYSSFSARKIIETAENQWFINSYISAPFDNSKPVNFKSFTKVGVNYNTQTRDVVVARFIIGELGFYNMYLILIMCLLPLLFYLISFKLKSQDGVFNIDSYTGLIPLILFFTICLFVWLTSTNRFVFFGQDFPFLSLTSKLSVLLPLMLFSILLIQRPQTYNFQNIKTELALSRYLLLFGLILVASAFTIIKNELTQNNFNVVVPSTKNYIEQPLDNLFTIIQDSLSHRRKRVTYDHLCKIIKTDPRYIQLVNNDIKEPYTKSILRAWEQNPSSAMRVNNPLYIRYDQGRYRAEYNNTLYLALPLADDRKIWHGSIDESLDINTENVSIKYNNITENIQLPYYRHDNKNNLSLCIIPSTWMNTSTQPKAILNVANQFKGQTNVLLQKHDAKTQTQSSLNFSKSFESGDVVSVQANKNNFDISFATQGVNYVNHKWVNNTYRSIYPMGATNFWVYNLANSLRTPYKNTPTQKLNITLDYNLYLTIHNRVNSVYSRNKKNKKINFSVIAADGNGNIRTMNDFNGMRQNLDPNNSQKIYKLQQEHFFYSNANKERKQWGNANLLHLHLGPGSSIKPAILAAIGSQAHLEWDKLYYIKSVLAEESNYAGLPIAQGWKNIEHYKGPKINTSEYIEHSSNFFHSVILFLGSYPKASFLNKENHLSLKNILTQNPKKNNSFPKLELDNTPFYLPNYSDNKWPSSNSNQKSKSYFANENSLLANGIAANLNLATTDIDKHDGSPMNTSKVFFFDSSTNALLRANNFINSIWTLPEASSFSQKMRHYISSKRKNEINENFNLGLKTPTLGGYPYQITPLKMLEMYNALFTQNMNYRASITQTNFPFLPWHIDSSWTQDAFNQFLANQVFLGMKKVITTGTGTKLKTLTTEFPQLNFYAKTGTINEESSGAASSRRLILTITDNDVSKTENINRRTKVYSIYFVIDYNKDFDWELVKQITRECIQSTSFKNYFNQ